MGRYSAADLDKLDNVPNAKAEAEKQRRHEATVAGKQLTPDGIEEATPLERDTQSRCVEWLEANNIPYIVSGAGVNLKAGQRHMEVTIRAAQERASTDTCLWLIGMRSGVVGYQWATIKRAEQSGLLAKGRLDITIPVPRIYADRIFGTLHVVRHNHNINIETACAEIVNYYCPGLMLDLKRDKQGRILPEQAAFAEARRKDGWRCEFPKTYDEFVKVVTEHCNG